ncbi:tyrosine kinase receptor Cad96Ca-like isoform X2 [Apostichopus japonicus]|uniref:tyrosine kinase receptor Cad96Ca-like isoform X2 n=1 Tax=Stichopus japonicus TaxID=307972 RepID=UPI003AB40568
MHIMNQLRAILFSLLSLSLIISDGQEQTTEICEEIDDIQPFPTTVCNTLNWDPVLVCLVCPVGQNIDVEWIIAETRIAYGGMNLGNRNGVSVDSCHETNASLSVKPCDDKNKSFIRCLQGEEVLAKFTFICKVDDKDINQSNPHDTLPPTTNSHPNFKLTMYITVGVTLSLAVGCTLAISVHCSLRKRGRFTTSEGLTPSMDMEDNVCYVGMVSETSTTMSLEYIVQTNLTDSNRLHLKPILNEQVLSGVPFEYWNAHMTVDGSNKMDCFAKKLSDKATIGDYATLKLLAESLSSFQMGEGFVKLLHISTQTIPFGFFYETMRCGTLHDHVMNHFRKKSRINKTIKRQLSYFYRPVLKELLIFAVNIAQAMHYLASQKFCHPALSLRKVLMTPQGSCKLYDIYPNNLCMERIKHLMKKTNPPTAWMATEILLFDKYFLKSDSWNFSVFLWELLSIGKIPFAGITQEDIKAKVLDGFMLSRPYVCPKDMFRVMVSCWQKNHTMRPSCSDILQSIRCEYEKLHEKCKDCDYSEIPE